MSDVEQNKNQEYSFHDYLLSPFPIATGGCNKGIDQEHSSSNTKNYHNGFQGFHIRLRCFLWGWHGGFLGISRNWAV